MPSSSSSKTASQAVNPTHSSLYRKYRPQNWSEVAGQAHIVKILEEEVKKAQPCHAFLFAGSRGTGKTTIARIFAANIGTAPEDIYEIDAASNTSVEDIRVLNEAVHTLPMNSKFKVYILDEVHMLSKSAFNAFLKTLEEPPKHVIFILATTELHKIPDTIVSRCQSFFFNKPSMQVLSSLVIDVAKKENVTIDPAAAELVAMVGNGSFRDTLSALQTVVSMAEGGKVTLAQVEEILSLPSHMLVADFIAAISDKKLSDGLAVLQKVYGSNLDVRIFTEQVVGELRKVMLGGAGAADSKATPAYAMRMIELLLNAKEQLGKTHISVLPLELALMRFFEVK